MNGLKSFKNRLKYLDKDGFEAFAMELFNFQYNHNPVYQEYVDGIDVNPRKITQIEEIPFLPISAFKHRIVRTGSWIEEMIFESSGTTGMETSKHFIEDLGFYQDVSTNIFKHFYGDPQEYVILALLPSYLERDNSSLIYMVNNLISLSRCVDSGFYLSNLDELIKKLAKLIKSLDRKVMLWGVTFALLDLADRHPMDLKDVIIVETGGYERQGRRVGEG